MNMFDNVGRPFKLLISGVLIALSLAACGARAGATIPAPAATAALPPEPTGTLPAAAVISMTRLAPSATPRPTPCQLSVRPALSDAWSEDELGCPITSGATPISTAYAPFEGGQMLWRGDTDTIYVLYHNGEWDSYPNEWREGDPTYSCGEESGPATPIRGFGRVWCDNEAVRLALGAVTAAEIGDAASTAQEFVNGTILTAPFGDAFVLVGERGVWRRVEGQ
ncbi:MAG: hypothetical protein LC131_14360 [Anaerolineae bacterium]|nr:hypothetical protein [Anaerolineae bacterium]